MANLDGYANRVRALIPDGARVAERRMFRSLSFTVNGHPTIAVSDGSDGHVIMMRVGDDESGDLDDAGHTGPRATHGWVYLNEGDAADDRLLAHLITRSISFIETLPPK